MPDDPATRFVPSPNNADPFKEMSAVPPAEDVELLFDKLINKFPFQERYLGCTNPFTGREIQSESEYRSLVRESAYIRTLNQNTDAKSGKGAEQQEQAKELERLKKEVEILQKQCRNEEELRMRSKRIRHKTHAIYWILIAVLLSAFVFVIRAIRQKSFDRGYNSAKVYFQSQSKDFIGNTENESEVLQDSSAAASSDSESISEETVSTENLTPGDTESVTEENSICYIGNVKSHVFHRSDCKNLPAEKNQIQFDSREQAIEFGYTPCGNCNP